MVIPFRKSLSYKQARNCLLVGFLIGLVLSSVQIAIDYSTHKNEIFGKVDHLVSSAKRSASYAAYNLNDKAANQLVSGLVAYGPIVEAKIIDDFDDLLGSAKQSDLPNVPFHLRWIFGGKRHIEVELLDINGTNVSPGKLSLVLDLAVTADVFMQRSLVVLALGIIRNFLLALMLVYVFHLTITKSLLEVSATLSNTEKFNKIPVSPHHYHDELGVLVDAFNKHLDVIDEQHSEIININEGMEHLVEKRTKQLAMKNEELLVEREFAINANLAKTDFLAMMSHEIRTPMNGILGMTQLMLNEDLPSKQKDWVETIYRAGNSLLSIINSILDYTRVGKESINLKCNNFSPVETIISVIYLMDSIAIEKGLGLTFDVEDNVPDLIWGDEDKLRQILMNIVNNAIKFTPQGVITLRLGLLNQREGKYHLHFEVEDQGIGISDTFRSQVFDEFSQADISMDKLYGGIGLGLSVCKRLVEKQLGTIGYSSKVGEGSIFWFDIPYDSANIECDVHSPAPLTLDVPPLSILVVEDVEVNRKYVSAMLGKYNHTITEAVYGLDALILLEDQAFDVVLMDVHMPIMDGIETTRRIRSMADPVKAMVPIIGLTANAAKEKQDECLEAGFNQVIIKPFKMEALYDAIGLAYQCGPVAISSPLTTNEYIDKITFHQHVDDLGIDSVAALFKDAMVSGEHIISCLSYSLSESKNVAELVIPDAHKLVGLCANYGLLRLKNEAKELEALAKYDPVDLELIQEKVSNVKDVFNKTRDDFFNLSQDLSNINQNNNKD